LPAKNWLSGPSVDSFGNTWLHLSKIRSNKAKTKPFATISWFLLCWKSKEWLVYKKSTRVAVSVLYKVNETIVYFPKWTYLYYIYLGKYKDHFKKFLCCQNINIILQACTLYILAMEPKPRIPPSKEIQVFIDLDSNKFRDIKTGILGSQTIMLMKESC